jgi:hypothetical protein
MTDLVFLLPADAHAQSSGSAAGNGGAKDYGQLS